MSLSESVGVVIVINSFLGKIGNIGYRASFLIDQIEKENIAYHCIARGSTRKVGGQITEMGMLGQIPRILNSVRIYINENFDSRKYDYLLFDQFISVKTAKAFRSVRSAKKILHSWEFSPELIRKAKQSGFLVIQDVPIAPTLYTRKLHQQGLLMPEKVDYEFRIKREMECCVLADVIIVPSDFVKKALCENGIDERKVRIIPFGVGPAWEYRDRQYLANKTGLDYCFAGNINERKGVKYLLNAFNGGAFENDALHLCGRVFKESRKAIAGSKGRNIVLPGVVNTAEYFKRCDVYVFPSLLEGSSKSVYEAMMSGLPIITTDNAGSIVEDGKEGFIVPAGSVSALTERMEFFKRYPEMIQKMGEAARSKAKKFSWERYACGIINAYREL